MGAVITQDANGRLNSISFELGSNWSWGGVDFTPEAGQVLLRAHSQVIGGKKRRVETTRHFLTAATPQEEAEEPQDPAEAAEAEEQLLKKRPLPVKTAPVQLPSI